LLSADDPTIIFITDAAGPLLANTHDDSCWPSMSFRCDAAIFPESEVDRTRGRHRESGAYDPERPSDNLHDLDVTAEKSGMLPYNCDFPTLVGLIKPMNNRTEIADGDEGWPARFAPS
jgi:hypothetical protein